MRTTVAIKICRNYNEEKVYDAIKASVDLVGGIKRFVKRGERILLKPNLLVARPASAAVTTHPFVVKAMIRLVKEAGGTPVVGDSPAIGSAKKIAEKCGILDVCLETGTELVEFKDAVVHENRDGHTFKRLEVAKEALEADGIINLPKLKTHAQMHLTLGVKNIFGCIPGKRKPQWHFAAGTNAVHFGDMILDLYLFLRPRLTVLDGIVAMEGNGPSNGAPRELGLVFASADAIAMDAVVAMVLGCRPHDLPILAAASRRSIKEADPANVETVGEDLKDVRVRAFCLPPLMSVNFTARLPYFIDRHLRKAITGRPHIRHAKCTQCSICVSVCPPSIMSKTGNTGKTKRIEIDYDRCIRCYCCQEVCPEGAITTKEGWLKRIIPGI